MSPEYSRQTVDAVNPLVRLAHRRRIKVALESAVQFAPANSKVLDYGSGPGVFLRELAALRPDVEAVGYDPFFKDVDRSVRLVSDMGEIDSQSIGMMTAFETCEHLDDDEFRWFVGEAKRVLRTGGKLLISVPIIAGPGLAAKELNHILIHRRASDYSLPEFVKATLAGIPASRAENIKKSHKGFDFRQLHRDLRGELEPEGRWYSPFPKLPWQMNSQAFSVWSAK